MPRPPLPPELQEFLRQPNPCVIATVDPNRGLHTAATWYDWLEDGTVMLNMDESRRRLPHMHQHPEVALTVLDRGDWYRHLSLSGRVREIRSDPDLTDIDRLAQRYLGQPYSDRRRRSWTAIVEVERWHGWEHGHPIATP